MALCTRVVKRDLTIYSSGLSNKNINYNTNASLPHPSDYLMDRL